MNVNTFRANVLTRLLFTKTTHEIMYFANRKILMNSRRLETRRNASQHVQG